MSTTLIILLILNTLSIFLIMAAINSLMNSEKRIRQDILALQQKLYQKEEKRPDEPVIQKTKEARPVEPVLSQAFTLNQVKSDKQQRAHREKEAQDAQRRFENEWYDELIKKIELYI